MIPEDLMTTKEAQPRVKSGDRTDRVTRWLLIVIGGSLTPLLRRKLVPKLTAIPIGWRLRFVLLCTAMASSTGPHRSGLVTHPPDPTRSPRSPGFPPPGPR